MSSSHTYNGQSGTDHSTAHGKCGNQSEEGRDTRRNSITVKFPTRPSLVSLGSRLRTSSSSGPQISRSASNTLDISEATGSRPEKVASPPMLGHIPKTRIGRTSGIINSFRGGQGHKARQSSFEVHSVRRDRPQSDYFDSRQPIAGIAVDTVPVRTPSQGIDSPDTLAKSLPRTPSISSSTRGTSSSEQAPPREIQSSAEVHLAGLAAPDRRVGDIPAYPVSTPSSTTTTKVTSHPPPVGRTRRSLANALGRRLSGVGEAALADGNISINTSTSTTAINDNDNDRSINKKSVGTTKVSIRSSSRESSEVARPALAEAKQTSFALRSMRKVSIGSSTVLDLDRAALLREQSSPSASTFEEATATTIASPLLISTSIPTSPAEGPQRFPSSPLISPSASVRNLYLQGQTASMSVAKFRNARVRSESGTHATDFGSGTAVSSGGPGSPIIVGTSFLQGEGMTPSEQLAALEAAAALGGRATPLLRHFEERDEGEHHRAQKASVGSYFTAEPGSHGDDGVRRPTAPAVPGKDVVSSVRKSRQISMDDANLLLSDPPLRPILNPPAKNTRRFSDRFELPLASASSDASGTSSVRRSVLSSSRGWEAATLLSSFGQRAAYSGSAHSGLLDALARLENHHGEDEIAEQRPTRPWLAGVEFDRQSAGGSSGGRTSALSSTPGWATPIEKAIPTAAQVERNVCTRSSSTAVPDQLPQFATLPMSTTIDALPCNSTSISASTSFQGSSGGGSSSNHYNETPTDDSGCAYLVDSASMSPSLSINSAVYENLSIDHRAYVQERHQVAFLAAEQAFRRTYEDQMRDVLATLPSGMTKEDRRGRRSGGDKRGGVDTDLGADSDGSHLQVPSARNRCI